MICPNCEQESLKTVKFHNIEADKCSNCQGIWFDQDELRLAKDGTDQWLVWLDVDLWKEKNKYKVSHSKRKCPVCNEFLYEVGYEASEVKIDICKSCEGVWLDRGEFEKIIAYLQHKADTRSINEYLVASMKEAKEILAGPEELSSEVKDFLAVFKLLQYKLLIQYPAIMEIMAKLPFIK